MFFQMVTHSLLKSFMLVIGAILSLALIGLLMTASSILTSRDLLWLMTNKGLLQQTLQQQYTLSLLQKQTAQSAQK
ncbi:MAG: hypothetical protein H0X30_04495 [Anaerolineae bacterium]|nr:hypothetical protein [Anaerolineae bacterium]